MSETQPTPEARAEEAAAWFARLNTRTISHRTLAAFRAWRQTPENAAAYAKIESLWGRAAALADDGDIAAAVEHAARPRRSWRAGLAALRDWIFQRPVLASGLALGVAVLAGFGALHLEGDRYQTTVGEQRLVRLADGSRLRLDTDSEVRVRLSGQKRAIELIKGQALFEVAPDPGRPFVVAADGATVRALGTRFDVRRLADGVKVTLIEGKIEVRSAKTEGPQVWSLQPGQQIVTGKAAKPPSAVDLEAATSWASGRLVFRDQPLSAAIAEVNRYSPQKIALESDRFASMTVNGVFDSGDTEAFVSALTALHPLVRTQGASGEIILRERSPG